MLLRRANSSEAPTRQPHRGQMLTLARCLRVGVDEFGALDKIAAVQLEGAPTFGLLDQPLEQGVQPRVGGLATCGRPGPPPLRIPGVGVIRSPWWRFPRYTWAWGSTLMTLAVQGASLWSRISSSYRPTLIKTPTSARNAPTHQPNLGPEDHGCPAARRTPQHCPGVIARQQTKGMGVTSVNLLTLQREGLLSTVRSSRRSRRT